MHANKKESLAREKHLEDKLLKVREMISKNIGRSQTDLMRAFENIKEEIMSVKEEDHAVNQDGIDEKVIAPNLVKYRDATFFETKLKNQSI